MQVTTLQWNPMLFTANFCKEIFTAQGSEGSLFKSTLVPHSGGGNAKCGNKKRLFN